MKFIKRFSKNKAGDTIIEVTIAMAVLGLVLGSAVALANRNSRSLQDTQDRTVGLRYSQSQLEYLQSYLESLGTNVIPSGSAIKSVDGFCMGLEDENDPESARIPLAIDDEQCVAENRGASYRMHI